MLIHLGNPPITIFINNKLIKILVNNQNRLDPLNIVSSFVTYIKHSIMSNSEIFFQKRKNC
jgi:hypothetical protein